jgi:neutral ceramidase
MPYRFLFAIAVVVCSNPVFAQNTGWKAGTAKAVITPAEPMWMAGYGGRNKPAEGTLHDLYIRVLALQDANGHRAITLSSDTLGISQPIYEAVVAACEKQFGLKRADIMLNASHTHCGPVLKQALSDIYPLNDAQRKQVDVYSDKLIETIVATIGKALENLEPVTLSHGQGSTDFAVNRRTNREPDVPMLRAENRLLGPVDHAVPVLTATRADGSLKAIVFAYACHNTVMDFYQWSGDYAGIAQLALEARHPNTTAMFAMGCGADQNPLPRRKVELLKQYGLQLADAVDAALKQPLKPLTAKLATAVELTPLKLDPLPPREQLEKMAAAPESYSQRWASRVLKLPTDKPFPEYPYPVQAWKLGDSLLWITLGGEVVVDYSLRFKGQYGYDTWVTAYANDVMAYIPSARVRIEGGYEGQSSMMVYGQPAERWAADVEDRVTAGVEGVVKRVQ